MAVTGTLAVATATLGFLNTTRMSRTLVPASLSSISTRKFNEASSVTFDTVTPCVEPVPRSDTTTRDSKSVGVVDTSDHDVRTIVPSTSSELATENEADVSGTNTTVVPVTTMRGNALTTTWTVAVSTSAPSSCEATRSDTVADDPANRFVTMPWKASCGGLATVGVTSAG